MSEGRRCGISNFMCFVCDDDQRNLCNIQHKEEQKMSEWEDAGMSEAEFYKYRYYELRRQLGNVIDNYLKSCKTK